MQACCFRGSSGSGRSAGAVTVPGGGSGAAQSGTSAEENRGALRKAAADRPWTDLLIYSESSTAYYCFERVVTSLCYVSSVFYMGLAAHREERWEADWPRLEAVAIGFECSFLVFMLLQFFKAYVPEHSGKGLEVRDFSLIARRYLATDFKMDLFALLPLQHLDLARRRQRLFYLLKLVRFKKGFSMLNIPLTMKLVKKRVMDHIDARCKVDKDYALSMHS